MTLILRLEQSPHPQRQTEMRYSGGNLVIGRGADADWTINDPDMFVSRAHCTISGSDGQYSVTDSSRGGLYVDGSDHALGPGKSTDIHDGMRIRMGDFVFSLSLEDEAPAPRPEPRVEPRMVPPKPTPVEDDDPFGFKSSPKSEAAPESDPVGFEADDFFQTPSQRKAPEPAPKNRPEPFESGKTGSFFGEAEETPEERQTTGFFDDNFTLGKLDTPRSFEEPEEAPEPEPKEKEPAASTPIFEAPAPEPETESTPEPEPETDPEPSVQESEPVRQAEATVSVEIRADAPPPEPAPQPSPPAASGIGAKEAFEGFLKGAGLDPEDFDELDPAQAMEAMGKRYRLLIEGLMHMLRARAQEKVNARLSRTIIGNSDVNPLKFVATTDEAVAATVAHKGHGYLEPETAINGAFRDLAEHHVNSWNGVQAALRRMIDRFDPAELEEELKDVGTLEALLAGGRRAKLWEAYEERYRNIAKSAEERFLGDVGTDFRDAYENARGDLK